RLPAGHEGHHAGRGPAAPRHAAVLGRRPGVGVTPSEPEASATAAVRGPSLTLPARTAPRRPAMSRLRTFIAVDLEAPIRQRLVRLQETLTRGGADVKWVEEENLHVSLLFLGEVDDRDVLGVCRATEEVCRGHDAFELRVEG